MSEERSPGSPVERPLPGEGGAAAGVPRSGPEPTGARATTPVSLGAAPRISGRCTWQVVEGEAVLLDLEGKRLLGLNRAASFVFPLFDGERTVAGLAALLAQRFGIEVARAEADLRAFLADLSARGFVEGVDR